MKAVRSIALSYLILLLIFSFLLAFFPEEFLFTENFWSWFFLIIAALLVLLRSLSGISALSLYSLQFYAFILFFGGRFISTVLTNIESPFNINFFASYTLNSSGVTHLMSYVICGMVAMELGFYLSKPWRKISFVKNELRTEIDARLLKPMFMLLVPMVIFVLYGSFLAVQKYGYLGLYLAQTGEQSGTFKSIVNTITFVFMGIAIAYGSKKARFFYIAIYLIISLANLLYGVRGGVVTFILFSLWIYGDFGKIKINLIKIFFGFVLIAVFLIYGLTGFSFRVEDTQSSSGFIDVFSSFLYDQGVTLMVFDLSTKTGNYPWIPYFQNIFPGVSFIVGAFSHVVPYETSFSNYLSYYNNRGSFEDGYGLGWAVFSDFYVYSKGVFPIFAFFAGIWGYLLSKMEQIARKDLFFRALLASAAPAIIFLPRAGLNTVFPLLFYSFVVLVTLKKISQSKLFRRNLERIEFHH